jgi:mono/diheme cytochrome c family protein
MATTQANCEVNYLDVGFSTRATRGDMRKTVTIVSVCSFILSASYAVLGAQGKASAGVYTAEQATRGEAIYKEQCAACHGDNLEGSGPMPPLAGMDFLTNWTGKSLADLFDKIQTTMPATAPGTMMPEQTADVLAFMLKGSKFPAGSTALEGKLEALQPISIDAP